MHRPRRFLSYDQIGQWVDAMAPELRGAGYTAVVGILRGGLFPAQCVAFATGLPLGFVCYSRAGKHAAWVGEPPPPGKLLLCEDVAGMGFTLAHCLDLVRQSHPDTEVLTVVSDELSRVRPRWSMVLPGVQTVFPWERHDQTPAHRQDWQAGGSDGSLPLRPDPHYRFIAVDLDGVLCEDLRPSAYEADLQACLSTRDALPLASWAPRLDPAAHVIVTGRPLQDRERTRAWLDGLGFGGVAVHHRDPQRHDSSVQSVAAHKGQVADRLGCSDFIESCPHQSALIAVAVPHIRVYWWNSGQPVLLSGVPGRPG